MRPTILGAFAGAVILSSIVAVLVVWVASDKAAQADPGIIVGFDMNPAGNSCPGTGNAGGTDCTLGSINSCVSVSAGSSFEFDVFIDGIPSGENFVAAQYYIGWDWWPPESLTLNSRTLQTSGINLLADDPGSGAFIDNSQPAVPHSSSPDMTAIADFGPVPGGVAETSPPFSQGVVGRYSATVQAGTAPGIYGLIFDISDASGGPVYMFDFASVNLCDAYGCELWDATHAPQYGLVAVDTPCDGGATPVPSPTATPTPTATATPTTPTATPTPGALVAGWNQVCYLGPDQPIADALAAIDESVLAVYRLTPAGAYAKWFPDRPDLSDISAVTSYQPLFILMASSAVWQQQPADSPPASVQLAQGWNSVCYSGQTKGTEEATAGIAGQLGVLYSLAPSQAWQRFIPTRPEISNLPELQQFAAVLALVTQPEGVQWAFGP